LRHRRQMPSPPLQQVLQRYKSTVSILKKGYKQETSRLEKISQDPISKIPIDKISSVDIARYRDDRLQTTNPKTKELIKGATVRLELSLLSNIFDISIIEWGYCENNPVKKIRKPKPSKGRERRLSPKEENKILRYAHAHKNPELYTIIVIALETAMRQSEILNLKWEDINLKKCIATLFDTKNGSNRDVPLSIKCREMFLQIGVKSQGKIFSYTPNGIKSTWRFMTMKLEIDDLHFHDLRHEATSRLFELGTLEMMEIASITGHKSLSMLKRYTHLKAQNLVSKLEKNKNKARQVITKYLVPYPAEVKTTSKNTTIRLLDFSDLVITNQDQDTANSMASDALLRRIMNCILNSQHVPQPDQYLETVPEAQIVMIDPMLRHAEP